MEMKVAILGCGPTGMFVAHAMAQLGHDFTIYSKKRRSEMFGAQYLHQPIPGLTESDPITIDYQLHGTFDGYRGKVYSGQAVDSVSPQSLIGQHNAWDIREAYYKAWELYSGNIVDTRGSDYIDARWVRNELVWNNHHVVISTIPAYHLCHDSTHKFDSARILAIGDAPERGKWAPDWFDCPDSTVICNGDPYTLWYRQSNIYGYRTIEWPASAQIDGAAIVDKPIRTDCDCFEYSIIRVGRYGKWQKGYLTHHAYYQMMGALG